MPSKYTKVSECPEKVKFLIDVANSEVEFDPAFWLVDNFDALKAQLKSVVKGCNDFANLEGNYTSLYFPMNREFTQDLYFRIVDNKISFAASNVIETLRGIDARRLKLCEVCSRIFWAKKLNSQTCGTKKCADELGNRKRLAAARAEKTRQEQHFQSRLENNDTL